MDSVANKMIRVFLLLAVVIFKVPGLMIGSTIFLLFLINIRTFNAPYMWPFIPFNPQAFTQIFFRRTIPGSAVRPSIVQPRDRFRQPPNS